jgi:hypothetical protein
MGWRGVLETRSLSRRKDLNDNRDKKDLNDNKDKKDARTL